MGVERLDGISPRCQPGSSGTPSFWMLIASSNVYCAAGIEMASAIGNLNQET